MKKRSILAGAALLLLALLALAFPVLAAEPSVTVLSVENYAYDAASGNCSFTVALPAQEGSVYVAVYGPEGMFRDVSIVPADSLSPRVELSGVKPADTLKVFWLGKDEAPRAEALPLSPEAGPVYALLYGDGELVFQASAAPEAGRELTAAYPVNMEGYGSYDAVPWYRSADKVLSVSFASPVRPKSTADWFNGCLNLTEIRNIEKLYTANVTDMGGMFSGCSALNALDVSRFDTANVTDMGFMFYGCSALTALNVSHFDTANVTNMIAMFRDCSALTALDVTHFDTANVTSMGSMFENCSSLTALDVSHFDTANVTSMRGMFEVCTALTALDVSHFDTANVTDMSWMFCECSTLTELDVSGFNTTNVTNMRSIFVFCSSLTALDVSHFDTTNVTHMRWMFFDCTALRTIYASERFVTSKLDFDGRENMFKNCTSLTGGAGTAYDESHTDSAYARIDGGEAAPGYFTAKSA